MAPPLRHISAISLFVEDLAAAKGFYTRVFGVEVTYEDAQSAVVRFENLIVNLLHASAAAEIVAPGAIAPRDSGVRCQLSIWVPDVEAVCAELRRHGVTSLTGPIDRPWNMRTANFVDPAGHSWEVAQRLDG